METAEPGSFDEVQRLSSDSDQLVGLTPTQRPEIQDLIDSFRKGDNEARRLVAELGKLGRGD